MKIFCSRFKKSNKWIYLITNDLSLSYIKCIEKYSKRWKIEVTFKELKQYLSLEKCQSNSFNAQIANFTCAFILHLLISYYLCCHDESTFGELFRNQRDAVKKSFDTREMFKVFEGFIREIGEMIGGASSVTIEQLFCSDEFKAFREILSLEIEKNLEFRTLISSTNEFDNEQVG